MTTRQRIALALRTLTEPELEKVAEYVAFLRFRARLRRRTMPGRAYLATLYGEGGHEDRDLAEAGMAEYAEALAEEDGR